MGFKTSELNTAAGCVYDFSALPSAAGYSGYIVTTEEQSGANKAGDYLSNGSVWKFVGSRVLKASVDEVDNAQGEVARLFSVSDITKISGKIVLGLPSDGYLEGNTTYIMQEHKTLSGNIRIKSNAKGIIRIMGQGYSIIAGSTMFILSAMGTDVKLIIEDLTMESNWYCIYSNSTLAFINLELVNCVIRARVNALLIYSATSLTARGCWFGKTTTTDSGSTVKLYNYSPNGVHTQYSFYDSYFEMPVGDGIMLERTGGTSASISKFIINNCSFTCLDPDHIAFTIKLSGDPDSMFASNGYASFKSLMHKDVYMYSLYSTAPSLWKRFTFGGWWYKFSSTNLQFVGSRSSNLHSLTTQYPAYKGTTTTVNLW